MAEQQTFLRQEFGDKKTRKSDAMVRVVMKRPIAGYMAKTDPKGNIVIAGDVHHVFYDHASQQVVKTKIVEGKEERGREFNLIEGDEWEFEKRDADRLIQKGYAAPVEKLAKAA